MGIGVCGDGKRGENRWEGGGMWDCGSDIPKGVRVDHWMGSRGSNWVDSLLCEGPRGYARRFEVMVLHGVGVSVRVGEVCSGYVSAL